MPRQTSKAPRIAPPARPPRPDTPRLALAKVSMAGERPSNGTVRPSTPHRAELARHRVMTADERDVAVATVGGPDGFLTGVYPVQHGYLVMMYQPLYVARSATSDAARAQHERLVRALADVGLGVIRARQRRERAPRPDASPAPADGLVLVRPA